ncbi:acyl-CoA thioesterase [Amycolatopsis lurida]
MAHRALVRPRWSDMDVYGHVNHANMVTLLEEARVPLLFGESAAAGLTELAKGIVVVRLQVDYRAPVVVGNDDVLVEMTMTDLRYSSFTIAYRVHAGPEATDKVAVTAETKLAPYDVRTERPRRLTEDERDFLRRGLGESDA